MDVAWYRGPQRSPPPSQRLENFVPGIQTFIEKRGTRINQPGGKLIRVSVEFAYQWPRHGNHRKRGVAQVSRCNIDKWRRLANRDILRLCSASFVPLSLARPFFSPAWSRVWTPDDVKRNRCDAYIRSILLGGKIDQTRPRTCDSLIVSDRTITTQGDSIVFSSLL